MYTFLSEDLLFEEWWDILAASDHLLEDLGMRHICFVVVASMERRALDFVISVIYQIHWSGTRMVHLLASNQTRSGVHGIWG